MNNWIPIINVTSFNKEKVCFLLKGVDISFANALRRIMISDVPTLSIDLVTIIENTSVLHDEFIAHRLGLLPIDSRRINEFKYKEDCSCSDRCRNCSVVFQLDVLSTDSLGTTVTHLDINGTDSSPNAPMPVPRYNDTSNNSGIVIAKLQKNQRLKCNLIATKGIGKLHAKWIPTGTAVYHYEPDMTINEKVLQTIPLSIQQEIASLCPRSVLVNELNSFKPLLLNNSVQFNTCLVDECVAAATSKGYPNLFNIIEDKSVFNFSVEGTGALPADQIVTLAFDVFESKLRYLLNEITKLEGFSPDSIPESSKIDTDDFVRNKRRDAKRDNRIMRDNFKLDLS